MGNFKRKEKRYADPVIDLTGPDGNAVLLIGKAQRYARQVGHSEKLISDMVNSMMGSDYVNVLATFLYFFPIFQFEMSDEMMEDIAPKVEKRLEAIREERGVFEFSIEGSLEDLGF